MCVFGVCFVIGCSEGVRFGGEGVGGGRKGEEERERKQQKSLVYRGTDGQAGCLRERPPTWALGAAGLTAVWRTACTSPSGHQGSSMKSPHRRLSGGLTRSFDHRRRAEFRVGACERSGALRRSRRTRVNNVGVRQCKREAAGSKSSRKCLILSTFRCQALAADIESTGPEQTLRTFPECRRSASYDLTGKAEVS